jgi:iron complex outermembrane receptor protein
MKKTVIILLIAISTQSTALYSQNKDSIKTYKGNEIVISANRSEIMIKNSPSFITIINEEQVSHLNGNKLADKLLSTCGITIKDYGYSGLRTISMRGMSAEHTLVLYDGDKLNSEQNGVCDLSSIMLEDLESIEVLRGGSSSYFGTAAVGGIINIIPKQVYEGFGVNIGYTIGSNNYNKYRISTNGNIADINYSAIFVNENSDNDYQYRFKDLDVLYEGDRKNSRFSINQFSINLNSNIMENSSLNLFTKYNYSDREIPDIILRPFSQAKQIDKEIHSILKFNYNAGNIKFSISPSYRYMYYRYTDPLIGNGISSLEGKSNVSRFGINSNMSILVSEYLSSSLGIECSSSNIECVDYTEKELRNQVALFLGGEVKPFRNGMVTIFPAVRYDYYDDFGSRFSPKIAVNMDVFRSLVFFKSGYSDNFRAPTFNELYWNPGGNKNLKPEKSNCFDIGFSFYYNNVVGINSEINYYSINTKNRIIWLPYRGTIWQPVNIQNVKSDGIEYFLEFLFFDRVLSLSGSYTYTNSKNISDGDANEGKFLPFIPRHNMIASIGFSKWNISSGLQFRFISSRYTDESNSRISQLRYYHLADLYLQYKFNLFQLEVFIKLETNNMYNSEYVVLPYYPTPLREYKLSFNINY